MIDYGLSKSPMPYRKSMPYRRPNIRIRLLLSEIFVILLGHACSQETLASSPIFMSRPSVARSIQQASQILCTNAQDGVRVCFRRSSGSISSIPRFDDAVACMISVLMRLSSLVLADQALPPSRRRPISHEMCRLLVAKTCGCLHDGARRGL